MKKRLLQIADYLNISIRELEQKSGLKRGNISNMSENSEIGSEKLSKIIDNFPQISLKWLLTGEGEMLKTNGINKRINLLVRNFFGENNYTFAKIIGVSSTDLINYRRNTMPGDGVLKNICEKFDIASDWLLFGEGNSMFSNENPKLLSMMPERFAPMSPKIKEENANVQENSYIIDKLLKKIEEQSKEIGRLELANEILRKKQ